VKREVTRRKLTIWIVAGALAAAILTMASLKRSEPAAPKAPEAAAAEQGDKRPMDKTPAQIREAPRSTQDVFMPPPTDATGASPAPK
jgi:hypothetical protein